MRIDFTDEDLLALQNRHNIGIAATRADVAEEERRAAASREAAVKLALANELNAFAAQAMVELLRDTVERHGAGELAAAAWLVAEAMQAERRKRMPDAIMHAIRFGGPCL